MNYIFLYLSIIIHELYFLLFLLRTCWIKSKVHVYILFLNRLTLQLISFCQKCDKSSNEVFDTHKGLCYSLYSHWSPAHSPGLRDEAPAHYTVGLWAVSPLHRSGCTCSSHSSLTRTRQLELQVSFCSISGIDWPGESSISLSDLLQKVACAVLSVRNFWTDSSRISANTLGSFSSEVREKLELEL